MSKLKLCVMAAWVALFFSPVFALESPTISPQTLSVKLTGKTVAVDVYKPRGAHTGAAILTHGGFRGRKTMAEHAQALAERGVLAVAPDMPCTFDHRCNARAIAELVKTLHLTEALGASAKRIMLVGFSAGGLASLLAADSPGVVGFVGLDPYDHCLLLNLSAWAWWRPGGWPPILCFCVHLRQAATLSRWPHRGAWRSHRCGVTS